MKRVLAFILSIYLSLSALIPFCSAAPSGYSTIETNMMNYLSEGKYRLLLDSDNYYYITFMNNMMQNTTATSAMEYVHQLAGTGSVLDIEKEKYVEVLVNVMALSEYNCASDIAEQKKQDNLKSFESYAMDGVKIATNAVTVMMHGKAASKLEKGIQAAIAGLELTADNTYNWIKGLSDLETIMQNYSSHDAFLAAIEENSTGTLKNAAHILRGGMASAMKIKLETYNEISNDNFDNYTEFFFDEVFFQTLKMTSEYESDAGVQLLTDFGGEAISTLNYFQASLKLGVQIGKLIGNIVVNGENMINRVREMRVMVDIHRAMSSYMSGAITDYLDGYNSDSDQLEELVLNYVDLARYMGQCEMRGEYCLYSIVASDTGLLSWFNKENAEAAEQWYHNRCSSIEIVLSEIEELLSENTYQFDINNIPSEAQEFNGHYYLICSPNQVTTWEEASAYCQNLGGYLATITSQEENTFLTSLITGAGRRSAYIGMSDKEEEGTWTWVTGEAFSYQNWRGNEPNNDDGDEYYVMVYDDGGWNDANFIYEEGRPSERTVQCYVKAKDDTLNLRAEPKYESDLAHEVTSDTTLMKFYGQIQQGLGSDGQMHDWYKVYIGSYVSGWARSDLIKQVDQKSIQGDDGVAFICEWGPYTAEGTTGNDPSTPSGSGSGASSSVRDVVLVLDVSGSMSGNPMEETKTAAVRFIETVLQENARIGIVTYDSQAERIADFSTNEAQLEQAVQSISSGSSTDIEAGLQEACSMLAGSQADKKILVLMSDGEPNEGKVGDELVDYADTIKAQGVRIYTLGFFESLSNKSEAQSLMERIATDGCHYEVASAEDLVFFFGDMADQINGQKYIYVRIACPVDVSVTYNGETLNSSENNQNLRTAFGTLTFEENDDTLSEGTDDRVKVLRLKEGADYDLELVGTGRGIMNYTIGFMDEAGKYSDLRKFENVKITKSTEIDTVAGVSSESMLNIDEDGDGKYDLKLRAGENGYGEEVVIENWVYFAVICACILVLIDVILIIVLKNRKRKKGR